MSLLTLVIVIVVVGLLLWLINSYIPMDATIKRILNIVVVIFLIFWILRATGVLPTIANIRI